jgi:hypothetical protein
MVTAPTGTTLDWWYTWRQQWNGPERKGDDSIFALVAWELWKERNPRSFRGATTQLPQLLAVLKHNAKLWVRAGAKNLGCLLARAIR